MTYLDVVNSASVRTHAMVKGGLSAEWFGDYVMLGNRIGERLPVAVYEHGEPVEVRLFWERFEEVAAKLAVGNRTSSARDDAQAADNILPMENLITKLDLDPGSILEQAQMKGLKSVIIIGETIDGQAYLASSSADLMKVSWALDRAKHTVNKLADEYEKIGE